jgi:hypothetical protein
MGLVLFIFFMMEPSCLLFLDLQYVLSCASPCSLFGYVVYSKDIHRTMRRNLSLTTRP